MFPINNIDTDTSKGQVQSQLLSETGLAELNDRIDTVIKNKEQFLVFVHPKCQHCQKFTQKLNEFRAQNMLTETTLLMYGAQEHADTFNLKTKNHLPLVIISKKAHLKTCKGVFPSVFFIKKDSLFGPINPTLFDPRKAF